MLLKFTKKWLILAMAGVLILASCPSPTSSAPAVPPAPAKPTADIDVISGANLQGSLFQSTAGTTITFDAGGSTPVSGSSLTSYDWNFDDASTGSGADVTHSFAANESGTYHVVLTVTDSNGQRDTESVEILINDPPAASIITGDITDVEGDSITFEASGTDSDGDIVQYLWDMGDGTTMQGTLAEHIYTHGGNFTVTLTVTDDDGTQDSDTISATISDPDNDPPAAAFSVSESRVNRDTLLTFNASDTTDDQKEQGLSYYWDFGDSTTAQGEIVNHSYSTGGDYTVTLNVTDSDGVSDATPATAVVSVNYQPEADFSVSDPGDSICYQINEVLSFTNSSADADGTLSYVWNFGDGSTSTEVNPTHTFTAAGEYPVSLTVTDNEGDTDSTSESTLINALPTVTITAIPTGSWVNQGSEFSLTSSVIDANDSTFTYEWDVDGDGTSDYTTSEITHTYNTSDDATITLTVTDPHGHSDRDTVLLEVNAAPAVSFTMDDGDGRINPNGTIIFDATAIEPDGDDLAYSWTVNGSIFSTAEDPSCTFTAPGSYTLTVTVTDPRGAQGSAASTVTVNAPPVAAFTGPAYSLEGDSITFTDSSSDTEDSSLAYAWDFGDSSSSTEASPNHTYTSYGSYTVSLTVTDDDGLSDTATASVAVNALPTAVISGFPAGDIVDLGSSFTLNGDTSSDPDDSIASYRWTMSDSTVYTTANITHTYSTNADGDITLTVTDQDGETDSTTYTIEVNGAPIADFTAHETLVNPGTSVRFDADASDPDSDSLTYIWKIDGSAAGTGTTLDYTFAASGDYSVELTVSDGRLSDSVIKSDLIHVNYAPTANAGSDITVADATASTVINPNGSASSDQDGTVQSYSWIFATVPTGSSFTEDSAAGLTGSTTATPSFSLSGEGAAAQADGTLTYVLELTVTDNLGLTSTNEVTVTVDGSTLVNVAIE